MKLLIWMLVLAASNASNAEGGFENSYWGKNVGFYPGSRVISHSRNDHIGVDFLTSINSYENKESWGFEKVYGENSVTVFSVPSGITTSTEKVFHSLAAEITKLGGSTVLSCSGVDAGCGFYMPRKMALNTPRKAYFQKMKGFWNLNSGDFHILTSKLTKDNSTVYISVVVARSAATNHIEYVVDSLLENDILPESFVLTQDTVADKINSSGKVELGSLLFDSGVATLNASSRDALNAVAVYLGSHPDETYQIVGHSDDIGSDQFNIDLSLRRAKAVIKQLQEMGLNTSNLVAIGKGSAEPVSTAMSETARTRNRRVEFVAASLSGAL